MTIYSLIILLSQFWTSTFVVPCPFLTADSWPAYRSLRRQVKWCGISISKIFPQFAVIHTITDFSRVNEAEIDFWGNSLAFSTIQWMLAIWSLLLLPFLNPACKSGSSWVIYCWSLAWKILSTTLLACKDNPETNPISKKTKTGSPVAEQSSWVPYPAALHSGAPSQVPCFVSTCLPGQFICKSDTSPLLGSRSSPSSCNTNSTDFSNKQHSSTSDTCQLGKGQEKRLKIICLVFQLTIRYCS